MRLYDMGLTIAIILVAVGALLIAAWNAETPQLPTGPEPVKYLCSSYPNKCICTQAGVEVSCLPSKNGSGDRFEVQP